MSLKDHSEYFDPKGFCITVLSGGCGCERDVSLDSALSVTQALQKLGAVVHDVVVNNHVTCPIIPKETDIVFNLLHGTFGEDGDLQELLEKKNILYTGEGVKVSRIVFNKILTKKAFERNGVPTPPWEVLLKGQYPSLKLPLAIKPPTQGSSISVHLVNHALQIEPAIADCLSHDSQVLVEQMIPSRELTVGILGKSVLPVLEIRPKIGFYDYYNKYTSGSTEYLIPAPLDQQTTEKVQSIALAATEAVGMEVYGRVDILLSESGIYVLEVNTIPGMTTTSLLPKAAAVAGINFEMLCCKILSLSLAAR